MSSDTLIPDARRDMRDVIAFFNSLDNRQILVTLTYIPGHERYTIDAAGKTLGEAAGRLIESLNNTLLTFPNEVFSALHQIAKGQQQVQGETRDGSFLLVKEVVVR